uniref:Uncharacterized protein n=1 Tax=Rhizophora mucronata TaxID=61149 RepID=A0A2P2Q0R5_RHIMU
MVRVTRGPKPNDDLGSNSLELQKLESTYRAS